MLRFQTILFDMICLQERFEKIAKAQLKKVTKIYAAEKRKSQEREKKEVNKY